MHKSKQRALIQRAERLAGDFNISLEEALQTILAAEARTEVRQADPNEPVRILLGFGNQLLRGLGLRGR